MCVCDSFWYKVASDTSSQVSRQDFRFLSVDCGINRTGTVYRCALTATLPLEGNLLFREATTSNNVSYLKIILFDMAVFRFCSRQDSALDWVVQQELLPIYRPDLEVR